MSSGLKRILHLVNGDGAANVVRQALAQSGRSDGVLSSREAYNIGPLRGIDSDGVSRIAFWNRLGLSTEELNRSELDEASGWDRVRASTEDVVLWYGPDPSEYLLALRACWQMREQPQRLHEVVMPRHANRKLKPFYGKVALCEPELAAQHLEKRVKIADVVERAARWEALRDEPGEWIRIVDGDSLDKLSYASVDKMLRSACDDGDWTGSTRVVSRVLSDLPVGDGFLFWRLRELVSQGDFEGRGAHKRLDLPEEVRPAEATDSQS